MDTKSYIEGRESDIHHGKRLYTEGSKIVHEKKKDSNNNNNNSKWHNCISIIETIEQQQQQQQQLQTAQLH